MQKITLDKFTKEQATDYANTEAEIHGFEIGSDRWRKSFKEYVGFAVGTMSLGRNPRVSHYKVYTELYPEIFKDFAGAAAKNYSRQDGGKEVKVTDIQNRILSSVVNLMKLFENGILGVKNTTTGNDQGQIDNSKISDLQFPIRGGADSDEEYDAVVKDVVYNWFVRDLITNCILESLTMFWKLTPNDVEEIMAGIHVEADEKNLQKVSEGRKQLIKRLRSDVKPSVSKLNYKKIIFGE